MSRLLTHRRKQNTKKVLFLFIVIVGLGVFLMIVGLRSAINATVFLNNIFTGNKSQTITGKKEDFFGTLELDEPPRATNAAEIVLSGYTTEYDFIEYYINNSKVGQKKIPSSGQFSDEIGKLRIGDNKIYVLAKTKSGDEKKESDTYTVIYKNTKPLLEIESPKDTETTSNVDITVKGKTDVDAEVKINNSPVVVSQDGSFSKNYHLQDGENKLEIVATDLAGNEEKKTLTVTYKKDE